VDIVFLVISLFIEVLGGLLVILIAAYINRNY